MSQMQERLSQIWGDSLLFKFSDCFWPVGVCDGESGVDVASADVIRFLFAVSNTDTSCKGIMAGKMLEQTVQIAFTIEMSRTETKISLCKSFCCARLYSEMCICF